MIVWDFSGSGFTSSGQTWSSERGVEAILSDQGYVPAFALGRRFAARVFTKPHCERGDYAFVVVVAMGSYEYPVRVISFPRLVDLLNTLAPIIRADAETVALPATNGLTPAGADSAARHEEHEQDGSRPLPAWLGG